MVPVHLVKTPSPSPSEIEKIWRRYDEDELRLTSGVSERMLERGDAASKLRILDIATGRGEPAIRAAQVTQHGTVVGIDSAAAMLKMAQERASREGVSNLQLLEANALELPPLPFQEFELALCRWGLMYFSEPKKTLAWVRKILHPSGKFVAAFWAEPHRVSYFYHPRKLLANYVSLPSHEFEGSPTFRYAHIESIHSDFEEEGWRIESIEEMEVDVMEARSDQELIAWVRAFGLNRLTQLLPNEIQQAWERELIEKSQMYKKGTSYFLGGTTRIVVASPR